MASKANKNGRPKIVSNESNTPFSTSILRPSSRRNNSLSSSPSQSSSSSLGSMMFFPDDNSSPIFSPTTPLRSSGIPFSWEKLPGIPKKQLSKKKDPCSMNLLPLPPSGNSIPSRKETSPMLKKYSTSESFRKDPFFAALVECSKDDEDNYWKGSKATTIRSSISDRFGFIGIYTSCKRTSAVSESSIVYLPRSSTHYLYNRR